MGSTRQKAIDWVMSSSNHIHKTRWPVQSERSQKIAEMLNSLLPDQPNAESIYQIGELIDLCYEQGRQDVINKGYYS